MDNAGEGAAAVRDPGAVPSGPGLGFGACLTAGFRSLRSYEFTRAWVQRSLRFFIQFQAGNFASISSESQVE